MVLKSKRALGFASIYHEMVGRGVVGLVRGTQRREIVGIPGTVVRVMASGHVGRMNQSIFSTLMHLNPPDREHVTVIVRNREVRDPSIDWTLTTADTPCLIRLGDLADLYAQRGTT